MKKPNTTRKPRKSTKAPAAGKTRAKPPKVKPLAKPATLDEIRDLLCQVLDLLGEQGEKLESMDSDLSGITGMVDELR